MKKGKKGAKSIKSKLVRTDVELPDGTAEKIEAKGDTLFNHSRKSYIEFLCMKDVENFEIPEGWMPKKKRKK